MVKGGITTWRPLYGKKRKLISIIGAVAIGVWAYFGIIERLNIIETNGKLMLADLEKNT